MAETPTLFTQDDTGSYVEYTPPDPPAFHETLPEDLRENDHLKEVKDSGELARYYVDLKSNYLRPPETADGYEFTSPDGFDLNEDAFKQFKETAFDNQLNQKQFEALMNLEVSRHQTMMQSVKENIESRQAEAEKALKTEWGDNYDAKLESAKKILSNEKIADESFKQFLEDTRFGDNPNVIKFFAKLGELISEDAFTKPGSGNDGDKVPLGEDGRPRLRFPSMEQ